VAFFHTTRQRLTLYRIKLKLENRSFGGSLQSKGYSAPTTSPTSSAGRMQIAAGVVQLCAISGANGTFSPLMRQRECGAQMQVRESDVFTSPADLCATASWHTSCQHLREQSSRNNT
jgi:hypothetical protein